MGENKLLRRVSYLSFKVGAHKTTAKPCPSFPAGDTDAIAAKVLEILEDPQLAERLRQAAVELCKANPWSKAARKEAKAYLLALRWGMSTCSTMR